MHVHVNARVAGWCTFMRRSRLSWCSSKCPRNDSKAEEMVVVVVGRDDIGAVPARDDSGRQENAVQDSSTVLVQYG